MSRTTVPQLALSRFSIRRPAHQISQADSLEWIAKAHAASASALESLDPTQRAAFESQLRRVVARVGCDATRIGTRGHCVPDAGRASWDDGVIYDVANYPHGKGTAARTNFYANTVDRYFEEEYAEATPPADIIHVTCTGYVSPSGAQRVVASKGWGAISRVTHAYHMGCYAAFPAIRMTAEFRAISSAMPATSSALGDGRVDIVHTELCSLHFDPADHSIEQLVVQSLFADGFIRYSVSEESVSDAPGKRLSLLALSEAILPSSAGSMAWSVSDHGMAMTLSRDVPERIGDALRSFVIDLYARAGLNAISEMPRTVFAVHPGGPKIIDAVRDRLELSDTQVKTSRQVLFDYGNMSSATLPHVWMRILNEPTIAVGSLVVSLAFGPGLTVCGAVFRKE